LGKGCKSWCITRRIPFPLSIGNETGINHFIRRTSEITRDGRTTRKQTKNRDSRPRVQFIVQVSRCAAVSLDQATAAVHRQELMLLDLAVDFPLRVEQVSRSSD
jgi:hypothetical protein